jgi:hypothetical protein
MGITRLLFPPNGVAAVRIPCLLCPSDHQDRVAFERDDAASRALSVDLYALNVGMYQIYDPRTGMRRWRRVWSQRADDGLPPILDGLSNTLGDGGGEGLQSPFSRRRLPGHTSGFDPEQVSRMVSGGAWSPQNGHSEWVCGRAIHTGFTTTFTPNTVVPHVVDGFVYDMDVSSSREGRSPTEITYGVITSRSYHPGTRQRAA